MKREMNEPANFDEAFRRWAERPPATSATDAARAVVARLQAEGGKREAAGGRRQAPGETASSSVGQGFSLAARRRPVRLSPALATLVAAALVLAAGTASFIRSLPPRPAMEGTARASAPGPRAVVPARDADVVLWLDDGTPVYVYLPGND